VTRLVLATHNRHKVAELRRILADAGLGDVEVLSADDVPGLPDVAETGTTFAENALLKAHAVAAATGLPAVADDSGLCVAVLGGSPGVFSARWSGRHGDDRANLELLLAQIADVPDDRRQAWFTCAAALALPDGREHVAEGRLDGAVVREPRGGNGFGYDPVFVAEGGLRTTAELSDAEKDAISHRGRALRALVPVLREMLPASGADAASAP
jgi:XTP/dITP diphosphohydrolase